MITYFILSIYTIWSFGGKFSVLDLQRQTPANYLFMAMQIGMSLASNKQTDNGVKSEDFKQLLVDHGKRKWPERQNFLGPQKKNPRLFREKRLLNSSKQFLIFDKNLPTIQATTKYARLMLQIQDGILVAQNLVTKKRYSEDLKIGFAFEQFRTFENIESCEKAMKLKTGFYLYNLKNRTKIKFQVSLCQALHKILSQLRCLIVPEIGFLDNFKMSQNFTVDFAYEDVDTHKVFQFMYSQMYGEINMDPFFAKFIKNESEWTMYEQDALRQVKIMNIVKCKYVVPVHRFYLDKEATVIVTPFIERCLFDFKPWGMTNMLASPQSFKQFLFGLLSAVDYMHSKHVGHFNIDSTNILIKPDFTPVLTGFSKANLSFYQSQIVSDSNQRKPARFASILPLDADEYSIGVLIFQFLQGSRLFSGFWQKNKAEGVNGKQIQIPLIKNKQFQRELFEGLLKQNRLERTKVKDILRSDYFCSLMDKGVESLLQLSEVQVLKEIKGMKYMPRVWRKRLVDQLFKDQNVQSLVIEANIEHSLLKKKRISYFTAEANLEFAKVYMLLKPGYQKEMLLGSYLGETQSKDKNLDHVFCDLPYSKSERIFNSQQQRQKMIIMNMRKPKTVRRHKPGQLLGVYIVTIEGQVPDRKNESPVKKEQLKQGEQELVIKSEQQYRRELRQKEREIFYQQNLWTSEY